MEKVLEPPKRKKPFRIGVLLNGKKVKGSSSLTPPTVGGISRDVKKRMIANLMVFRERSGMSLEDLARDARMDKEKVASIEEGKTPVRMLDLYAIIKALAPPNGVDFVTFFNLYLYDGRKIPPIEPRILPLVEALNATGILATFSSCEGHYAARDQRPQHDRNFADVRFSKFPEVPESKIEALLLYIMDQFPSRWAVMVDTYKKYISSMSRTEKEAEFFKKYFPDERTDEAIYLVKITPKGRFDRPGKKRRDTDEGILEVSRIVREAIEKGILNDH